MGCNTSKPNPIDEHASKSNGNIDIGNVTKKNNDAKLIKDNNNNDDDDNGIVGSDDDSNDSTLSEDTDTESSDANDNDDGNDAQRKIKTTSHYLKSSSMLVEGGNKSPRITPISHIRKQLVETEELNLINRETALEMEHDRQLQSTKKKLEKRQAMSVRRMKSLRKSKADIRKHKREQKRKIQTLEDELLLDPANRIDCSVSNNNISSLSHSTINSSLSQGNNVKIIVENDLEIERLSIEKNKNDLKTMFQVEQIVNEHKRDKLRVESAESYERLKQQAKAKRKILKRKTGNFFGIKTTDDVKHQEENVIVGNKKKMTKKNTWMGKTATSKQKSPPRPKTLINLTVEEGSVGISLAKIPERKVGLSIKRIDKHNYYLQNYLKGKKELKLGHVLYRINDELVYNYPPHEAMSLLKNSGRPIKLTFCIMDELDKILIKNKSKK